MSASSWPHSQSVSHIDSLWLTVTHSELLWLTVSHSDSLWLTVSQCESLWLTVSVVSECHWVSTRSSISVRSLCESTCPRDRATRQNSRAADTRHVNSGRDSSRSVRRRLRADAQPITSSDWRRRRPVKTSNASNTACLDDCTRDSFSTHCTSTTHTHRHTHTQPYLCQV